MFRYLVVLLLAVSCVGDFRNGNKGKSDDQGKLKFPSTKSDTLWRDFHHAVASNNQEYLLSISEDSIDCIICEYFLETGENFHSASFFFEDSLCREAILKYGPNGKYFEFYNSWEDEEKIVYTFLNNPECESNCSITIFYFEKRNDEVLFTGVMLFP